MKKWNNLGDSEKRKEESKKINLSIHHLSKWIMKLSQNSSHIPYRDSILTKYLKDTLKGNANTVIIWTVRRKAANSTHIQLTLDFGMNAQQIKTTPVKNVEESIPILKKRIKLLEDENTKLKSEIKNLNNLVPEDQKTNIKLSNTEQDINAYLEGMMNNLDDDEFDETQAILRSSKTTFNELNQTIVSDITEFVKTKSPINDKENNEMSFEVAQLEWIQVENYITIEELKNKIYQLETKITQNNKAIQTLQEEILIREEEHKEEILEKNNKIQKEVILKNQALDRMKELQEQNLYLNESLENKECETQELNDKIESLKAEVEKREESSLELNEMFNEANKVNQELQNKNNALTESLTESESKLQEALVCSKMNKWEVESLIKQKDENNLRILSLEESIKNSLQKHTEEILEKENQIKSKNEEIRSIIDEKTDKSNNLETELQTYKNNVLSLKEENEMQKSKLNAYEQTSTLHFQEIESLKSQLILNEDLSKVSWNLMFLGKRSNTGSTTYWSSR